MNGSQFAVAVTLLSGVFFGVCVYFDYQRHRNPYLHKRFFMQRSRSKRSFKKEYEEEPEPAADTGFKSDTPEGIILSEIKLAESLMDAQNYEEAVVHFANAIACCADPYSLIAALKQTLPSPVFDLLMRILLTDYADHIAKFQNDVRMKPLLQNYITPDHSQQL